MLLDKEIKLGLRSVRTCLRFLVASLYKIEIKGGENVPKDGAALFVSNHIAYADPMVISAATAKPIRFLMWRSIFEWNVLAWFFRLMREIPISPNDSPRQLVASIKEARKALEEGERVGLFAEGAITRFSQTRGFRNGMEHIVRGLNVPIIPTHIDRMWGSIFSFERGKFIWKKPRLSRLPITISFGKPLPSSTPTYIVRQAVMELGCAAFEHRLDAEKSLHETFLSQAKKQWSAPCLIDESGKTLTSYGDLAANAVLLARRLRRRCAGEKQVAVLFPSSPASTLSLLALMFSGKIPVPLDPTQTQEKLNALCASSDVTHILTSRKIYEKFNFSPKYKAIYLEDIPSTPQLKRVAITSMLRFLPRIFTQQHETAAVLFSDATERPIPVPHSNITACLLGLQEVLSLGPKDIVASGLHASDSLAFTAAFWWPLLRGAKIKQAGNQVLVENRFLLTRDELRSTEYKEVPQLTLYDRTDLSMLCVSALDVKQGEEDQKGQKAGTVGRPLPGVCIRIVDSVTGEQLPPGRMGLLQVKNSTLHKVRHQALTEDGWYNTGDEASCDEEGFVTFPRKLAVAR